MPYKYSFTLHGLVLPMLCSFCLTSIVASSVTHTMVLYSLSSSVASASSVTNTMVLHRFTNTMASSVTNAMVLYIYNALSYYPYCGLT